MTGALHPALAPLLAGGGTPGRLAATAGELRERMERLLSMPRPRLLDHDSLAPLIAPPEAGDTLVSVLARLAGGPAETVATTPSERSGGIASSEPIRAGDAAPTSPLSAEIAAHARALPRPPTKTVRPRGASAPVAGDGVPTEHTGRAQPVVSPDWQAKAALLGADRRLDIVADPPAPASTVESGGTARRPADVWADDPAPEASAKTSSPSESGSAGRSADPPRATASTSGRRTMSGSSPMSPPRRAGPATADAASPASRGAAATGPVTHRPGPRAVTLPEETRVGGFAGLAALGRAASPEAAPADPAPPPESAGKDRSPRHADRREPAEGSPRPDAGAVIAELADMLRQQILAAGIDLSGRRP